MSEPVIRAEGLVVRASGVVLVGPVALEAHAGAFTCLLGRNGSGKTTVLRALAGLSRYDGRVTVGGAEVRSLSPRDRARRIAYVPQQSALAAGLPVRSVVAQGRFAETASTTGRALDPVVESAMRRTDVLGFADRAFPTLSHGEQRRVLVARALATGARCILLDEPDAYLDVGQRVRLFDLLHALRDDGTALVVVVHALAEAREHADACFVMDAGKVVASGAPASALSAPTLRDVFGVAAIESGAPRFVLPEEGLR